MNAVKTVLYMAGMHGFFTYYLPWQLTSYDVWRFNSGLLRWVALPLWLIGTIIILRCTVDMIHMGRGTPAHLDPPQTLIVTGLYRYVRNPIYLGSLLIQSATILWFGCVLLILYVLFFIIAYQTLIVVFEEPALQKMFGAAYNEYRNEVPRWIPRL